MAKKLIDYYDIKYAEFLANKFKSVVKNFNSEKFIKTATSRMSNESFLQRQDIYVDVIEDTLGSNYKKNIKTFKTIWGEELLNEYGMFKNGWWLWPIGRYVERHGCENRNLSYDFIKEFTKRQTGEYAIRPLLTEYTELTMKKMLLWSKDKNVHVRRLSSEGLRINLPWARKTTAALNYYSIFESILTNLKDDSSKFVQKSVGNNLNDLFKHNPKLAEKIVSKWSKSKLSDQALWIIKHGRRNFKENK
jgi:3-methyladenine DNA glycosylase AlkC